MFKKLKPAALLFVLLLPIASKAQICNYDYLGTKTLYRAIQYKSKPAPAGYEPVFINHVGRHGARHLTKEVSTSFTYALLGIAEKANGLTAEGKRLQKMVMTLDKVEHGQVKSISEEGKLELEGIGKRMVIHYPQAFPGKPLFSVAITKEIRTKQSADAFLQGLKTGFKDSAQIRQYTDDVALRFYDASPTYTAFEDNGSWQATMQTLQQKLGMDVLKKSIVKKWLTPAFIKTLKPGEDEKLVNDVFGFATIVASLRVEIPKAGFNPAEVNFSDLFTCAELTALSKIDVADDYLKKGPGTNNNGIQVRIAAPLLVDFINSIDTYTTHPDTTARLRFAHAETISPFATLLGITQASVVAKDITKLDAAWQSSKIIPLSSNIQWIVYRKKGVKDMLVKVLLNEQEVHINGLTTTAFPYYKWSAMRAFYMAKLKKLNVGLTDDMKKYLAEVK